MHIMAKKLYLIDGNSFIYRMYFALPEFSTSWGKVVNATFGIAKFFLWQLKNESPDYVLFIRDAKGKNFRHDLYSEYKATRDRMPDSLRSQIEDIQTLVQKMGFESIEIPWYEADDVIAACAKKYQDEYEIYILSGDKDLHALVNEHVKIYDTLKKKILGIPETQEKFWIQDVSLITDYLAIAGDTSDNIPWIAGIWPAKAVPLLNQVGSVETIYEIIDKIQNHEEVVIPEESKKILSGKTLEKFIEGKENAFLSKKLATLDTTVDISHIQLGAFAFNGDILLNDEVKAFFKELEFFSLLGEEKWEEKRWKDLWLQVKIIWDSEGLKELKKKIENYTEIVLDTETTSLNTLEAEIVGISLYLDEKNIYYINLRHRWPQVKKEEAQEFVTKLFDSNKTIIGHNLKYDLEVIDTFFKKDSHSPAREQKSWITSQGTLF